MRSARRAVLWSFVAVGGLVMGLIGSFTHGVTAYGMPVGLVLALLLSLFVFTLSGRVTRSAAGAALAVFGWLVSVLPLAIRRAEGDLIVAGTGLGYSWLIGGTVVAGAAIAWPYGARRKRPVPMPSASDADGR